MKKKKLIKFIMVTVLSAIAVTGYAAQYAKVTGERIANSVVRLHVVANSDIEEDQKLKLKVRDEIIKYTNEIASEAKSAEETKQILAENIEAIQSVAETVVKNNGATYKVAVKIGTAKFPTKIYGDTAFPAGEYEALNVIIGEGMGKNWWCVLYPQLCINNHTQTEEPSDNSYAKLSEESKKRLSEKLSKEEYEIISKKEKTDIKIKFKLIELFGKCK